jgi:hypothetical protein
MVMNTLHTLHKPVIHATTLCLLIFSSIVLAASQITATVDRTTLSINEAFTLSITVNGSFSGNKPDMTPIQKDFELLSTSQSNNISYINGQMSQTTQWHYKLLPLDTGQIIIPALQVGTEKTQPITITVTDSPPVVQGNKSTTFLEAEASPQTAYVQSQILYRQKAYVAVPLSGKPGFSPPRIKDGQADIYELGVLPVFQEQKNGHKYYVYEKQYLIFPQKSGKLTIGSSRFQGIIPDDKQQQHRRSDPFGNGFFDDFFGRRFGKSINARSKVIKLNIQPQPSTFKGKNWIAATNLQIHSNWSLPTDQLKAGEPVELTIAIIADGVLSEQLPEIQINAPDNLKTYPEKPELRNSRSKAGVTGTKNQRITVIATGGGEYRIPAIEIPWWNTATNKIEISRLEEQILKVSGAPAPKQEKPSDTGKNNLNNQQQTENSRAGSIESQGKKDTPSRTKWIWLIAGLTLGGIIFFIAFFLFKLKTKQKKMKSSPDKTISINIDKITNNLRLACEANDPELAEKNLRHWGEQVLQLKPATMSSLSKLGSEQFKNEINKLSIALYGKHDKEKKSWNGKLLWQAVEKFQTDSSNTSTEPVDKLASLYPQ